ncbi:histone-fold-containing protein [Myxozyma melibiosi]|uniref:DNA polymerase epsilon subunit D n=1 Tax=Myxozyma melibiosi TaxID=54550 RepID=A0ABR1F3X1_9ASCO
MPRAKKIASPAAEQPATEDHSNIDENGKNDSAGIDEFVLPKATVTRLAKSVLPQNTQIQKDAMTAVSKSATVFVNYLTATANELTVQSGRRTINPNDVYQALEILELPFFLPRLKAEVSEFNKVATSKRQAKATASQQQLPQQHDQDEELAATKTAKVEGEDKAATHAEDEGGDQQNAKKASAAKRRAGKRAKTADGKAAVINAVRFLCLCSICTNMF